MFNKKFLVFFVILLCFFFSGQVFARGTSESNDDIATSTMAEEGEETITATIPETSKFSQKRAVLGLGNDCWNLGQSKNYDDGLSFSLNSYYKDGPFIFSADLNGYTNRGYKETSSSNFFHGRFDKLSLNVSGLLFEKSINGLTFFVRPSFGVGIVGDFAMEGAQNAVHNMLKLYEVHLPEEFEGYRLYPNVNLEMISRYTAFKKEKADLNLEFSIKTENTVSFDSVHSVKLEAGLIHRKTDIKNAYFFLGYNLAYQYTEAQTHRLYIKDINGFKYGFGVSGGLVNMDYARYTGSNYGYAYLMLDFMSFFREKCFNEEDFSFEIGHLTFRDNGYEYNKLERPLFNRLSLVFKEQSTDGAPSLGDRKDGITVARYKHNYTFLCMDMRYTYGVLKDNWLKFYGEAGFGFVRTQEKKLYNMDPAAARPESVEIRDIYPFMNVEAGLLILPDSFFVTDNCRYKLMVFGGVNFVAEFAMDKIHSFGGGSPYLGFGVHADLDI